MRALVTGAGRRLGRAMALELAARGYDVAVHYATSAQDAEETAGGIRALGRQAAVLQADLLDEAQAQALLSMAPQLKARPRNTCGHQVNRLAKG